MLSEAEAGEGGRSAVETSPIFPRLCAGLEHQQMPREHDYFVYVMTCKRRSALYIGMTNNLERRVWQHRNPEKESFTQQYHCVLLVYYEHYRDVLAAIEREKQLKGWSRAKKIALIEKMNPRWVDLAADILR